MQSTLVLFLVNVSSIFLADFNMSKTQKEHAATIEKLVTDIASLRQNLGGHLSYGQFWMIYFVLLLPSLDDTSRKLLSSAEVKESLSKVVYSWWLNTTYNGCQHYESI